MKRAWDVLQRVAPQGLLEAALAVRAWREVAQAEGLPAEAEFRGGRLTVYAASSAQAQEVALRCRELLARVNERVPAVREIRVRTVGG